MCLWCCILKTSLSNRRSAGFSLMFCSRGFIVFYFSFRSIIHFEIIFRKGVRSVAVFLFFFFFNVDIQLFQHHLLKRLPLFHCISFDPLSRISCPYFCGPYFWALFCSMDHFICSLTNTTLS